MILLALITALAALAVILLAVVFFAALSDHRFQNCTEIAAYVGNHNCADAIGTKKITGSIALAFVVINAALFFVARRRG